MPSHSLLTALAVWCLALSPLVTGAPSLDACPHTCLPGKEQTTWGVFPSVSDLASCDQPMLLGVNIFTDSAIRACKATNLTSPDAGASSNLSSPSTCSSAYRYAQTSAQAQVSLWNHVGAAPSWSSQQLQTAGQKAQAYLSTQAQCNKTNIIFAADGNVTVGIYSGAKVDASRAVDAAWRLLSQRINSNLDATLYFIQACQATDAGFGFGIVVSTNGSLSSVQHALAKTAGADCSTGEGATSVAVQFSLWTLTDSSSAASKPVLYSNSTTNTTNPTDTQALLARSASCATHQVASGDNCFQIAQATNTGITAKDIGNFNNNTWGWSGCAYLMVGQVICVSAGDPPQPAADSNAVCGPTALVNGVQLQRNPGQTWADVNPCPLNACCNVWGQCGIDGDFCISSPSDTGAPGTSKPGKNGCVSNCGAGSDVLLSNALSFGMFNPAPQRRITYYEGWNSARPCLNTDPTDMYLRRRTNLVSKDSTFTVFSHIHFAFGGISYGDWTVTIDADSRSQFAAFAAMPITSTKKILSIGGWSFSTSGNTSQYLQQGVMQANRQTLASNVVKFINDNGLDGVDFDWEYPGAADIYGMNPGSPDDGANYLAFLKLVRSALPAGKTLSIAAPASYWYLRHFPIKEISNIVDYIVYMTYDLHGQWDYGSKWSQPGCPTGDCLRSHVNLTETFNALGMIAKAGVDTTKVVAGVSSYGRSFKMAQAGCSGDMCHYLAANDQFHSSLATPGGCTNTGGYLADAEIKQIISSRSGNVTSTFRDDTASDIIVYNGNQYVAYMTPDNKAYRSQLYGMWGFGGTVDWAFDLEDADSQGARAPDPNLLPYVPPTVCDQLGPLLATNWNSDQSRTEATGLIWLHQNLDSVPPECVSQYSVWALYTQLDTNLATYARWLADDWDRKWSEYNDAFHESTNAAVQNFAKRHTDFFTCYATNRDGEYGRNCDCSCRHFCEPSDVHCYNWRTATYPYNVAWSMKMELWDDWWHLFANEVPGVEQKWVYGGTDAVYDDEWYDFSLGAMRGHWSGFPNAKYFYNPSPIEKISPNLPQLQRMKEQLGQAAAMMQYDFWDGDGLTVVTAASPLNFMLEQALVTMAGVRAAADKMDERRREQTAMMIVTIVLAVLSIAVPFLEAFEMPLIAAGVEVFIAAGQISIDAVKAVEELKDDPNAFQDDWTLGLTLALDGVSILNVAGKAAALKSVAAPSKAATFFSKFLKGTEDVGGAVSGGLSMVQDIMHHCLQTDNPLNQRALSG